MPDEFVPTGTLLALAHPDPPVDDLPMLTQDEALALQTETAGHLVRAITRLDDVIAVQTKRMEADIQAWQYEIGKLQARRENWRAMISSWMQRTGTFKLATPWFTCSLSKGRSKIVVDDEQACLKVLKDLKADSAIQVKESIIKKEFDAVFNSIPSRFGLLKDETGAIVHDAIAHEETGEPTLRILRK